MVKKISQYFDIRIKARIERDREFRESRGWKRALFVPSELLSSCHKRVLSEETNSNEPNYSRLLTNEHDNARLRDVFSLSSRVQVVFTLSDKIGVYMYFFVKGEKGYFTELRIEVEIESGIVKFWAWRPSPIRKEAVETS